MKLEGEGKLFRIFLGESDRLDGKPLYEVLVKKAREFGLAGATVLRGVEGFGAKSRIHTAKILRLSEDLPLVVEIVDSEMQIKALMPLVDEMFERSGGGGMITLEKVEIVRYTHGQKQVRAVDDRVSSLLYPSCFTLKPFRIQPRASHSPTGLTMAINP